MSQADDPPSAPEDPIQQLQRQIERLQGNGVARDLMISTALLLANGKADAKSRSDLAEAVIQIQDALLERYDFEAKPAFEQGVKEAFELMLLTISPSDQGPPSDT